MKVMYVAHSADPFAGSTKALLSLLDELQKRNVIPLVILPKRNELVGILRAKGVLVEVLNYRMAVYPPLKCLTDYLMFLPRLCGRIWLNNLAYHHLFRIAKTFNPNVVHTNVSVIDIGYKVAHKLRIPHIWHVREYASKIGLYHYPSHIMFLNQLKNHSYAICITKDIQQYCQLNGDNSCVIYDGVLRERQIRNCVDKEKYFLFAGRLEPSKGISDLLVAFAEFCRLRPDAGIILKVAGDSLHSQYYNFILDEVERMQIGSKVDFLGMRKDVLDLMAKAYLMVVPSRSEGFGFITTEAQFNGALVLGKDVDGTKEQFDNGLQLTGDEIALRYRTHTELVQCMCEVVDNGIENYVTMIDRSQRVVSELYTIERCAKQVYDFYKYILKV